MRLRTRSRKTMKEKPTWWQVTLFGLWTLFMVIMYVIANGTTL